MLLSNVMLLPSYVMLLPLYVTLISSNMTFYLLEIPNPRTEPKKKKRGVNTNNTILMQTNESNHSIILLIFFFFNVFSFITFEAAVLSAATTAIGSRLLFGQLGMPSRRNYLLQPSCIQILHPQWNGELNLILWEITNLNKRSREQ